jgi:hypothetical protein
MISLPGFDTSTRVRLLLTGSLAFALIPLAGLGVPVAALPSYSVLYNMATTAGDPIFPHATPRQQLVLDLNRRQWTRYQA